MTMVDLPQCPESIKPVFISAHMNIEMNCILMLTHEHLDEFMLWCRHVECWHVNVICWHVEWWHVRMWDVNMWEYENILCQFSMDMDLRTRVAWCRLYKVFEKARWCRHRECALRMTRCWVHMSLRMHVRHVRLDVGYARTCERTRAEHVWVNLWTCTAYQYVWMLSTQELGTMSSIENENEIDYNVVVPEY